MAPYTSQIPHSTFPKGRSRKFHSKAFSASTIKATFGCSPKTRLSPTVWRFHPYISFFAVVNIKTLSIALGLGAQAIHRSGRGDVQRAVVSISPGEICRLFRNDDSAEVMALRVPHPNSVRAGDV